MLAGAGAGPHMRHPVPREDKAPIFSAASDWIAASPKSNVSMGRAAHAATAPRLSYDGAAVIRGGLCLTGRQCPAPDGTSCLQCQSPRVSHPDPGDRSRKTSGSEGPVQREALRGGRMKR